MISSRFLSSALLALLLFAQAGCGGGGEGESNTGPSSGSAGAEVDLARRLQAQGLEKNPQYWPVTTPFLDEPLALLQMDQRLLQGTSATIVANRYFNSLSRLAQRAQIARVFVYVSRDLACTSSPFGGGVAADTVIVIDGKMLDLMADVANGLAMRESGRLSLSIPQIVDSAASQQMSFARFCTTSDPLAFPDAALSSQESSRAVEIFTQFLGGVFFHEFGHTWNWHSLFKLRENIFVPGGGFSSYTSAVEDNADIIAGILSGKSGHDIALVKVSFDLMAFSYLYRRSPGSYSFNNTTSWQSQYSQTSPNYSSLAARKSLLDVGFIGWQRR